MHTWFAREHTRSQSRLRFLAAPLLAVALMPAAARAQNTVIPTVETETVKTTAPAAPAPVRSPVVIDSHQIDRYVAIRQLEQGLKADPNNLTDWIILGELAHDVAMDLPAHDDDVYYTISRQAYDNALRLDPNNARLQAAARFARDQEAAMASFDAARVRAVPTYLAARRRELSGTGAVPPVQTRVAPTPTAPRTVVNPPVAERTTETSVTAVSATAVPVTPGVPVAAVAPVAPAAVAVAPAYRPYWTLQGTPVTYEQFSRAYTVPTDPAVPTVTMRHVIQQYPPVDLDEAMRRATGVSPNAPAMPSAPR